MNRMAWVVIAFLLGSVACQRQESESPTKGRVTAIVSESHAALMQKEADEFHRLYEAAYVTLLPASTREAIVHLFNDSVRIIITDRQLNAEERSIADKVGLHFAETKIAEDALAIVVHKQNPVQDISLRSITDIVRGKIKAWSEVPEAKVSGAKDFSGPIVFVFTGRNSGAYELLAQKFLHLQEEVIPSIVVQTQKEVLDYITTHPRALGIVSAACFYNVTRPQGVPDTTTVLRPLAVERQDTTATSLFVKLHQANIYRGFYPFHYGVYIYVMTSTARAPGPELGFSTFVASAPGQKIILNAGLVPATMPIRLVQINED